MNLFVNTYHVLSTILFTNVESLVQYTTFVINELMNINFNSLATTTFLTYIDVKTKLSKWGTYLYTNHAIIKNTVDKTSYKFNSTVASYNKYRIEPFDTNWVCISILLANDIEYLSGSTYVYLEYYQDINPHTVDNISKIQYYNKCLQQLSETARSISIGENIIETMVTLKSGDIFFNKTYNKEVLMNTDEQLYSNIQSRVSFITIDYTHPDMPRKIIINIPKNAYYVNNIILSPLFLKRYLEYQSEEYVFDDKYLLKLMDNSINILSLRYNESILIKEKSYEVIRNE